MNNQQYTCCLCSKNCEGWGNNPQPVVEEGRCCDECNSTAVIPARIQQFIEDQEEIRKINENFDKPTREELRQRLRQNIRNKRK